MPGAGDISFSWLFFRKFASYPTQGSIGNAPIRGDTNSFTSIIRANSLNSVTEWKSKLIEANAAILRIKICCYLTTLSLIGEGSHKSLVQIKVTAIPAKASLLTRSNWG